MTPRPSSSPLGASLKRAFEPRVRTHDTWAEAHAGEPLLVKVRSLYPKEYQPGYEPDSNRYGALVGFDGITTDSSDLRRFTSMGLGPFALVVALVLALSGLPAEALALTPFALAMATWLPLRTLRRMGAPRGSVKLEPESAALVGRLEALAQRAAALASSGTGPFSDVASDLLATLVAERTRLVRALELVQGDLTSPPTAAAGERASAVLLHAVNGVADLESALAEVEAGQREEAALATSTDVSAATLLVTSLTDAARDARQRTRDARASMAEMREHEPSDPGAAPFLVKPNDPPASPRSTTA
jgi:hypothetical protein